MKAKSKGTIETGKDGVVGALKGTGDIAKTTADAVSSTLSTTLKDVGLGVAVGAGLARRAAGWSRPPSAAGAGAGRARVGGVAARTGGLAASAGIYACGLGLAIGRASFPPIEMTTCELPREVQPHSA